MWELQPAQKIEALSTRDVTMQPEPEMQSSRSLFCFLYRFCLSTRRLVCRESTKVGFDARNPKWWRRSWRVVVSYRAEREVYGRKYPEREEQHIKSCQLEGKLRINKTGTKNRMQMTAR